MGNSSRAGPQKCWPPFHLNSLANYIGDYPAIMNKVLIALAITLLCLDGYAEEAIDATDPTKIYSFFGGGPKYSDFTTGEHLVEARLTVNLALNERDMILGEAGYGRLEGSDIYDEESGWTDARFRWFHIFDMDYETLGYRGWSSQVDLQLAGQLPGTDGQNLLVIGAMPAWSFSENLSLYLSLNVANAWDKHFDKYNGAGAGFDAQLIYSNEDWWPGAQVRLIPVYTYFLTGELDGEGSGNFDINIGGQFTSTLTWDFTYQKNVDKDLKSFRRDETGDIENDWNVFFNVTRYF